MRLRSLSVRRLRTLGAIRLAGITLFLVAGAVGCRPTDLGTQCQLARPICLAWDTENPDRCVEVATQPFTPEDRTKDYIATGIAECEHFTCVASAGNDGPAYCTRQCLENDQCRGGENPDLVCRELVLDDDFLADLCDQLGPERCQEILGGIRGAKYCALPLDE